METDGSDCPEGGNSTDCLLRTLLHLLREQRQADDAETNWDPITFWFTLVIGVAAALIAVVTALQAILAASRGRRKTNERAIGKWSRQTETHRSWRDMSVQSTTWTPVLRTDTLVKWHKSSPNENNTSGGDGQSGFHIIVRAVAKLAALRERLATLLRKRFHRPRRIQPSAATWLGFFDQIGLTEVNLPGDRSGLRQTVADYLPDDLIAAPAYAQVGVIIAATAAVGARFEDILGETRYPLILGRNLQFDFRQHPILGTFGAYTQHVVPDSKLETPNPEELTMAMEHARGMLETNFLMVPKQNLISSSFRETVVLLCQAQSPIGRSLVSSVFRDLPVPEEYIPILSPFLFRTPELIPAIFPDQALETLLPLTAIALNGHYWKSLPFDKFGASKLSSWPSFSFRAPKWSRWRWYGLITPEVENDNYVFDGYDEDFGEYYSSEVEIMTKRMREAQTVAADMGVKADCAGLAAKKATGFDREELELEHLKADGEATEARSLLALRKAKLRSAKAMLRKYDESHKGHYVVLQMCIKFLNDPDRFLCWFFNTPLEARKYLRWIVHREMKELDHFLGQRHKGYVKTRIDIIRNTTVVLLNADEAVSTGEAAESQKKARNVSPGQHRTGNLVRANEDSPHRRHTKPLEYIRSLLEGLGLDMAPETSRRMAESTTDPSDLESMQAKIKKCADKLEKLIGNLDFDNEDLIDVYRFMEVLADIVIDQSTSKGPNEGTESVTVGQDERGEGKNSDPQGRPFVEQAVTSTEKEDEEDMGKEESDEEGVGKEEADKKEVRWEQQTDEERVQTDEVITYRYLIAALLFRTAQIVAVYWNRVCGIR